jgi:hypothetical protein
MKYGITNDPIGRRQAPQSDIPDRYNYEAVIKILPPQDAITIEEKFRISVNNKQYPYKPVIGRGGGTEIIYCDDIKPLYEWLNTQNIKYQDVTSHYQSDNDINYKNHKCVLNDEKEYISDDDVNDPDYIP